MALERIELEMPVHVQKVQKIELVDMGFIKKQQILIQKTFRLYVGLKMTLSLA